MPKISVEELAAMVQRGFATVDQRFDEFDKFTGAVLMQLAAIQNQLHELQTKLK